MNVKQRRQIAGVLPRCRATFSTARTIAFWALALAVEIAKRSRSASAASCVAAQVRKSFCGDVLAGDLAQIRVDLLRGDRVLIARRRRDIGRARSRRQVSRQPLHDARASAIVDAALVAVAAFAAEAVDERGCRRCGHGGHATSSIPKISCSSWRIRVLPIAEQGQSSIDAHHGSQHRSRGRPGPFLDLSLGRAPGCRAAARARK